MSADREMMLLALRLAARGQGHVEPNPMVGAVITLGGRIVGKGYHRRFGGPHAEIDAIRDSGGEGRCRGATLHVTLEPCCHHGKTPPCTDAVLRAGFARVVAAMRDPFVKVRGRGLRILERAGIEVEVGLLEAEAKELNAPYIKLRARGIPYFIAKWAMSADGKIATATGDSKWISCVESRRVVHQLRARVDAVMVGIGTALRDDPRLTCRLHRKRNAKRIVVDSLARLPANSRLVRTASQDDVIVAVTAKAPAARVRSLESHGCHVLRCRARREGVDPTDLAEKLGKLELTNILVEGGSRLFGSLFDDHLVDEIMVFIAPILLGSGAAVPAVDGKGVAEVLHALRLQDVRTRRVGCDLLLQGRL